MSLKAVSPGRPLSQLPSHLATLDMYLPGDDDYDEDDTDPLQSLPDLPASLAHLTLRAFDASFWEAYEGEGVIEFPPSLLYLSLDNVLSDAIKELPPHLKTLILYGSGWLKVPLRHASLRTLELDKYSEPILAADLPNLTELSTGTYYNRRLDDLPRSLSTLTLGARFGTYGHALDHLPASLKTLRVLMNCKQPLDNLPSSLLRLTVASYLSAFGFPLDHLPEIACSS